jgi:hypothetical protein
MINREPRPPRTRRWRESLTRSVRSEVKRETGFTHLPRSNFYVSCSVKRAFIACRVVPDSGNLVKSR